MEPTEQALEHSDSDVSADEIEKLTALMDDNGSFGDLSEANDPEESEEAPQPQKTAPAPAEAKTPEPQGQTEVEVEHEGRKYKLPAELKDAFLRQADYTRKTQEVAQERTTVQQQRAQLQQLAAQADLYVGHYAALKQVDSQLQQLQGVNLNQLDDLGQIKVKQAWHDLTQARQAITGQIENTRQQFAQFEQAQQHQVLQAGMAQVQQAIPDFGPEKQKALIDVAVSLGVPEQAAKSIMDPVVVIGLNEIHTLRAKIAAYEGQRAAANKQIRAAPKMVRPEASPDPQTTPERNDALQRLRKSHSDEDAVASLKHLLG